MSVTTCPSCSTPVPPGAVFCDNCGYDLRTVAPPAPQPIPPTYHVPQPGGGAACPSCGHVNLEGSVFCENCGAKVTAPTPPAVPAAVPPAPVAAPPPIAIPAALPAAPPVAPPAVAPAASIPGRLVIQSANVSLPFPPGKPVAALGREDPVSGVFPEIDLDPYGGQEAGVGRKHAQILVRGEQVFLEDMDSVNGTVLNRQRLQPRQPQPIKNGDEIRLGKMILVYYSS